MSRVFTPPNIVNTVPSAGFYDETLDKEISTKTQWKEEMRKQGVTPRGDTPKLQDRWV